MSAPTPSELRQRGFRRSRVTAAVFAVAFLAVSARLGQVQVLRDDQYAAESYAQSESVVTLAPDRGRLLDRNGRVLAASLDSVTVVADPGWFRSHDDAPALSTVADALAPVLGVPADSIVEQLARDGRFAYLARQQDMAVRQQVTDVVSQLDIRGGIYTFVEPRREYPLGDVAAQVIGLTNIDGVGQSGFESQYDDRLVGVPGELRYERDALGQLAITTAERRATPAQPGDDLVLTIDADIQAHVQDVLGRSLEQFGAEGISAVVIDVDTGGLLAVASAPSFDPEDRDTFDPAATRLRPVTDVFEPGSVQKALTAAAAFRTGVATPSTTLAVPDTIQVGGSTFSDSHRHPVEQLTFAEVVERSSNVGTIDVATRIGEQRLHDTLETFGYGQPTGIDFPGEVSGLLHDTDGWWATTLPTVAIGYGVSTTLLQVASAYAAIANDGTWLQPHLLSATVDDGATDQSPLDVGSRRVMDTEHARWLQDVLAQVVDGDHGTGGKARLELWTSAGKTGTARKARTDGRGYSRKYVSSFVGFAPATDPEVVVAVSTDSPDTSKDGVSYYASQVAAPLFADIATFTLSSLRVPPDRAPEDAASTP